MRRSESTWAGCYRYMLIAVVVLLAAQSKAFAGTHLPEDPNLAQPGYCDETLVKTQLERARCDTKDAVAGGFFWITPFEKQQIDDAVAECEKGGSCQDAEQRVAQLAKSINEIKDAFNSHNRRAGKTDAPWLTQLAAKTGGDPTGYGDLVRTFFIKLEARKEATVIAALPPGRPIRAVASASRNLSDCLSDVTAAVAGNSLVVGWRNPCQSTLGFGFGVLAYLFDANDRYLGSFASVNVGYTFRMAGRSDGPTATGTLTFRCSDGACRQVSEKPETTTRVALDLNGRIPNATMAEVAAVRLQFK